MPEKCMYDIKMFVYMSLWKHDIFGIMFAMVDIFLKSPKIFLRLKIMKQQH